MDAVAVAEAHVADQSHDSPQDGNNSTNGETDNRFQKAIAAWRSKSSIAEIITLTV